MSADTKTNFEHLLIAKNSIDSVSDSVTEFINKQEHFLKVVREYADKAYVIELTKVYNIIGNEICSRAEIVLRFCFSKIAIEIYKEICEIGNKTRCTPNSDERLLDLS